jgi:hypothetical protein
VGVFVKVGIDQVHCLVLGIVIGLALFRRQIGRDDKVRYAKPSPTSLKRSAIEVGHRSCGSPISDRKNERIEAFAVRLLK